MGVLCEIQLDKPSDVTYKPGDDVSGVIKYSIDDDTLFKDIVLCLRGEGYCSWLEGASDSKSTYYGYEEYVHTTESLLDNNKDEDGILVKAGVYKHRFKFVLPENIPPSYNDKDCTIVYCVKLNFEKAGFFGTDKTFTTEIRVANIVDATLPRVPMVYGTQKSVISFSGKSYVNMKVTIKKSALRPGDTAELNIQVKNDSNTHITAIETQLIEEVTYLSDCGNRDCHIVPVTKAKYDSEPIKEQQMGNLTIKIKIPEEHNTIQHSKVFLREYKFRVKVVLPFPHTNLTLNVPVQIGDFDVTDENVVQAVNESKHYQHDSVPGNVPPKYWKAMKEDKDVEHNVKKFVFNDDKYIDDGNVFKN